MLTPHDRISLLDSLRPPTDFVLDTAIATTFSLDLIAMMVAPVGFTFFELNADGDAIGEQTPLELLEAIRRHASQIVLFCQAGRIAVPSKHQRLFSYLEGRIVQAKAPREGRAFHPKIWVIRFKGPDGAVIYRLLCLSRNLTFDRSLDSAFVVDGPLRATRATGFSVNTPLREFLSALPSMAVAEMDPKLLAQCALVTSEIQKVEWQIDDLPFDAYGFCPLGHKPRSTWPFGTGYSRMLVASPFVSDSTLERLSQTGSEHVLISRADELDKLKAVTREGFTDIHVLRSPPETIGEVEEGDAGGDIVVANDLHAKLYVADQGWNATMWTGSANATKSAFDGNVEFLVELTGKRSQVGVDAFLAKAPAGSVGIPDILQPYTPTQRAAADPELEALTADTERVRSDIACLPWLVRITGKEGTDTYSVSVECGGTLPAWQDHIAVACRPLSLAVETAKALLPGLHSSVAFDSVSLEGLTAFLVFEVTATRGEKFRSTRFTVPATLHGEPANRREKLLQSMLRDRKSVIRFLLLLLSEAGDEITTDTGGGSGWGEGGRLGPGGEGEALLEPLLRTFERDPQRLVSVASMVREYSAADEADELLPPGLRELVEILEQAREGQVE